MEDIVCHSVYDYDTVYELNKFFLNRRGKSNRFLNAVLITVNIIIFLIFVFITAFSGFDTLITVATLLIVLLDALCLFCCVALPKIVSKKASAVTTEITFRFKEDEIEIEAKKPNFTENSTVSYEGITDFEENKNYFYLFISKNQAYVVDINRLENSNPSFLRNFLTEKCKKSNKQ